MATSRSPGPLALIADDDEFFRSALRAILTDRLGFAEVLETGSLDEAIERMSENANLVLAVFDLLMPGMANAGSLRAVREVFPDVSVAVVSASERRQDVLQALEAGVHGYVPKSHGIEELTRALNLICSGTIYVPKLLAKISPIEEEQRTFAHNVGGRDHQVAKLTARQHDVLELIVRGQSNKHIARSLNLGEGTVKVHIASLFRILGVNNRASAAVAGARLLAEPH